MDAPVLEEAWVDVLAAVYRSVDWRRAARGRNPLDVFEHRLRFASYEPTVPRVLERLMNTLGLQAPRPLLDVMDSVRTLRDHEEEAILFLRDNLKLLVYLAYERVRKARQRARNNGDG